MGYNFDLRATEPEPGRSPKPRRDEVEWIPLQNHPVFSYSPVHDSIAARAPRNLLAWDGASRLHFWDSDKLCLHRISIRLGENPNSVTAASPSKVLQPDVKLDFAVHRISIKRNGSALLLSGSSNLCVMYLYGRTSNKDNATICSDPSGNSFFVSQLQASYHL